MALSIILPKRSSQLLILPGSRPTRMGRAPKQRKKLGIMLPGETFRHDLFVPGTDPDRTRTPREPAISEKVDQELLYDPPELSQYAKRGDPDMREWPGTPVDEYGIMAAAGDPRDWFRYQHCYGAVDTAWAEWASGFSWNQILILGDYGTFKTIPISQSTHKTELLLVGRFGCNQVRSGGSTNGCATSDLITGSSLLGWAVLDSNQ